MTEDTGKPQSALDSEIGGFDSNEMEHTDWPFIVRGCICADEAELSWPLFFRCRLTVTIRFDESEQSLGKVSWGEGATEGGCPEKGWLVTQITQDAAGQETWEKVFQGACCTENTGKLVSALPSSIYLPWKSHQDADFHKEPDREDHQIRGLALRHCRKCIGQGRNFSSSSAKVVLCWWAAGRCVELDYTVPKESALHFKLRLCGAEKKKSYTNSRRIGKVELTDLKYVRRKKVAKLVFLVKSAFLMCVVLVMSRPATLRNVTSVCVVFIKTKDE